MSNVPVVHGFGASEAGEFDIFRFIISRLQYNRNTITCTFKKGNSDYQKVLELSEKEFLLIVQSEHAGNQSDTASIASLFVHCKNDGADHITTSNGFYNYKTYASTDDSSLSTYEYDATVTREISTDGTLTITIKTIHDFVRMCLPYITIVGIK